MCGVTQLYSDCRCVEASSEWNRLTKSPMKKASEYRYLEASVLTNGRCERIRTFDPLHPMQVRYQAAPHTESE